MDVFGAIGPAVHVMSQSEKPTSEDISEAPINHPRNMSDTTPTRIPAPWPPRGSSSMYSQQPTMSIPSQNPSTPEQINRVIDDTIDSYQGTGESYNSSRLRESEDSVREYEIEDPYTLSGATANNWSALSWRLPRVANFRADEDEDDEKIRKLHREKALKALEIYDTRPDKELEDVCRERNLAGMSNMPPAPETPTKESGTFGMRFYRK
ncbi:hypothetical protein EG329_002726 [Mollisiaceae sp. DMI_Dod_QoI]|nr:hypothetical protein EG329_002726 [Helotiales sp. DMI_Dod_QoI]